MNDELRLEYDLTPLLTKVVCGKYAHLYREGANRVFLVPDRPSMLTDLSEDEIDEIAIAQADDDSAWRDIIVLPAGLEDLCQRWQIQELALFGAILRPDFNESSDIDMLVTFAEDARWGLLDHEQIRQELTHLFGRKVDLVSKRAVEKSHNQLRRQEILESAQIILK